MSKFESTGTVQNITVPVTQSSARSVENIDVVVANFENDLGLQHYKIKLTQELKPLDHDQKRRMFVTWAEQQLENDLDYY